MTRGIQVRLAAAFLLGCTPAIWVDGFLVMPDAHLGGWSGSLLLGAVYGLGALAAAWTVPRVLRAARERPEQVGFGLGLGVVGVPWLLLALPPAAVHALMLAGAVRLAVGLAAVVAAGFLLARVRWPLPKRPGLLAAGLIAAAAVVFGARDVLAARARLGEADGALAAARRPDVVLVVLDTLRADAFRDAWRGDVPMPWLAEWSRDATVYTRGYSGSNFTPTGHSTFFTGLYPAENGTLRKGAVVLPEPVLTAAELLGRYGYRSAGVTSNPRLSGELGFAQGFERWDDSLVRPGPARAAVMRLSRSSLVEGLAGKAGRRVVTGAWNVLSGRWLGLPRAEDTTRAALAAVDALEAGADEPLFLFVNYIDPHLPYDTLPEHGEGFGPDLAVEELEAARMDTVAFHGLLDRYREELEAGAPAPEMERRLAWLRENYLEQGRELDAGLRALFAGLEARGRLGPDTLVVISADHGEMLGEHGAFLHGSTLYEPEVRVPYLVRGPGFLPGEVDVPVSGIDFLPTVLHAMRVPDAEWPELAGAPLQRPLPDRVVRFESGAMRGFVHGPRKMIAVDRGDALDWVSAFDLAADPGEDVNRIGDRLRWVLEFAEDPPFEPLPDAGGVSLGAEWIDLEALGYAGEVTDG